MITIKYQYETIIICYRLANRLCRIFRFNDRQILMQKKNNNNHSINLVNINESFFNFKDFHYKLVWIVQKGKNMLNMFSKGK